MPVQNVRPINQEVATWAAPPAGKRPRVVSAIPPSPTQSAGLALGACPATGRAAADIEDTDVIEALI